MDKYEFKLSLDEINQLIQERRFEEAANIADTIDWTHVRSVQTLGKISEVYKIVGDYGRSRDVMEIAYGHEPENPGVVYSLCELSLHLYGTGSLQDDYMRGLQLLQEYQKLEPRNPKRLILQYRMYDVSHVSDEEKITVLEQLKREKPTARWELELAKLYAGSGDEMRAAALCTDIMEIFGGKYGNEAQNLLQKLRLDQQTQPGASAVDVDALRSAMGESPALENGAAAQKGTVPSTTKEFEVKGNLPAREDAAFEEPAAQVRPSAGEDASDGVLPQPEEADESGAEDAKTGYGLSKPTAADTGAQGPDEPKGLETSWETLPARESRPGQVTDTETSINEVMAEWERIRADIRRANDEKRAQRILEDTGSILQNFDETARHGLLEDIEKGVARQRRQVRSGRYGMSEEDVRQDRYDDQRGYDEPLYDGRNRYEAEDRYDDQAYEGSSYEPYDGRGEYGEPGYDEYRGGEDEYASYADPADAGRRAYEEPSYAAQDRYDAPVYEGEEPVYDDRGPEYDEPQYYDVEEEEPQPERGAGNAGYDDGEYVSEVKHGAPSEEAESPERALRGQEEAPSPASDGESEHEDAASSSERQGGSSRAAGGGQAGDSSERTGVPVSNDEDDIRVYHGEDSDGATRRWNAEEVHRAVRRSAEVAAANADAEPVPVKEEAPLPEREPEDSANNASALLRDEEQEMEEAFYDEMEENPAPLDAPEHGNRYQEGSQEPVLPEADTEDARPLPPAAEGENAAASAPAKAKGKRELTVEERRLFGPFCRMKDNVDQLTEALEQISLSSTTGNLMILGNEATADRVAKGILDIVRRSDPNFTGKIAKATGESLNRLDARGFSRTFSKLENGALIVTQAGDIAPKTTERLYQEIEGHEHGLILILTDVNKKMEQFRKDCEGYLGSFTATINIRPLDDKALVSYAKDYAMSQDYSIDEFGQLALAQRISSMQTQAHHVTLKEVRDLVDEAISYASKKNVNTLMEIVTRKRYDADDRIVLHEKDFTHY